MRMSRLSLYSLRHPIVQAPMAGGPSTPALAAAVSRAGGVGFLAAGYKTVDQVERELAGTVAAYQDMISRDDAPTALTRAFTGRTARGIINRFLQDHAEAPSAYPEIHHLTAPLRTAARTRGDADSFHLWAGEAHALAQPLPAADLVVRLATEAREALKSRHVRPAARRKDHRHFLGNRQ
jgi:nitronate monooxygenase